MPDYYSTLGLSRGATEEEIRRAYKELAIKCHPDKNPHRKEEATKKFQELLKAYEVLIENTKNDKGVSHKGKSESFTQEAERTDESEFFAENFFQSYKPPPFANPYNCTGSGVPDFSRYYSDSSKKRTPRPTSFSTSYSATTSFQSASSAGTLANGRPFYEEYQREESIVNGNKTEKVVRVVNGQKTITIRVNGVIRNQYVFPDPGPDYRAQYHTPGNFYSPLFRPNNRCGGFKTGY